MNLLVGILSADRLSKMTSEEMANDDVKKQREKFVKEGIDSAQLAKVEVSICFYLVLMDNVYPIFILEMFINVSNFSFFSVLIFLFLVIQTFLQIFLFFSPDT